MKLIILVAFTLVIIATSQASQPHDEPEQHQHKKTHLGFFGSRGRRSISETPKSDDVNETNIKSLTNNFMDFQRNIRAPKGFFGMRGKKDYDLQVQEKRALLGIQQNLNGIRERTRFVEPQTDENEGYPSYLPKRAPSQAFFGMRGKKFGDYDLGGSLNDKRAPSGFMGMRGKKNSADLFDDDDVENPQVLDYNSISINDKRAPSSYSFMGVRGKKLFAEPM